MEGEIAGNGLVGSAGTVADEPRDANIVRELLRSMGVDEGEYEPRVLHQLLEIAYRYVVEVLSDAQLYADHAGKPLNAIDSDDVRLSIQSKVNSSFSQPPPREVLLEMARNRNKIPLPKTIAPPGSIPLPPDQDTLISPNYQLLAVPKQYQEEMDEGEPTNPNPTPSPNPNPNPNASPNPNPNSSPNPNSISNVLGETEAQVAHRVSFQLASAQRRMN